MLKLDLNLLWTVVDVLILYVLLRKFLFKPIQNVLWRSSARTSCGKQMHRLRHWHAPCAKSF